MIRISAVSYLNTKPFLYGIRKYQLPNAKVTVDIPSRCAEKLLNNEADLGLVPVAIIPFLQEPHIIPGFCIGANGPVESVKLYSEVPLRKISNILCDYQSRTSVMLARILAKNHWNISPNWIEAQPGFEAEIKGRTAGVVIGDRTFELNGTFPYEWDLSEEWTNYSSLSFVFACWVSNKPLPPDFLYHFANALELGIENIPLVAKKEAAYYPDYDVAHYLHNCLQFRLDRRGTLGMSKFLSQLQSI
jgi:chorismate dehydratase